MSFTLNKVRLWRHVEKTVLVHSCLKPKEDNSEDQIKKIFAREEKICEFEDNALKTIAKIGKICTNTVQKELFLVKAFKE